jgi:hypothetical protein
VAIDIRATVTCSLGTLISGSVSDDYVQGSGLVKTRGNCEISGIITPAVGTVVTFDYIKSNVTREIPRKLRVLSSFADPFRGITSVELGCKLTYLSDLQEPIQWSAFDDPENEDLTEDDSRIITIPIYASSVMDKCLTELGIVASSNPLTNVFSIAAFDFGSGYVQILGDLLVSESYFGYLDTDEVLQIRDLSGGSNLGPVFTNSDIIELGPIGVGQLAGEAVTVSYSSLKLKEPTDDDDAEKLNWEEDETIGLPTDVRVDNPFFDSNPFPFPVPEFFVYRYIPRSKTITKYDELDRVTTRTTTEYTILAAIAPGYVQHIAGSAPQTGPVAGNDVFTIVKTERFTYVVSASEADPRNPPENYQEVFEQVSTVEEPVIKLNASTTIYDVAGRLNVAITYGLSNNLRFIAEKTSTKYEYGTSTLGAQIAKVLTRKSLCRGYTQEGQQELATFFESLNSGPEELENDAIGALLEAEKIKDLGTEIQISIGREIGLQQRPSSADLINGEYSDGGDPNNGWRVESESELELALGSATAQRRIELSLPYAPDDRFAKITTGEGVTYFSIASDAPAKANRYGRVQNRLLLGNRNGINLQVAPERLPAAPFSPLYVQAGGLTALYRANGNQWAFDCNGLVCSTDALFWGAVGGTGTFWFPVAPGITTLPTTPPIVDGEMDATTVVLPYNETAIYDAQIRLGNVVTKFNYALELLTEVDPLVVTLAVTVARVKLLASEVGALTLNGQVAGLVRRYRMVSVAGSFALSGFSAGSIRDYIIGTNSGTFTATGQAAMLEYERLPLIAEAGAFALDGEDATLRAVQSLLAEVGSFTLECEAANFIRQLKLDGGPTSLVLTGNAAQLFVNDYFSSWATQTYGFESLVYPDWWAE